MPPSYAVFARCYARSNSAPFFAIATPARLLLNLTCPLLVSALRRQYLQTLCEVGFVNEVGNSSYVYRYFPKDLGIMAYSFTSKLQQEVIQDLLTHNLRELWNGFISDRFEMVTQATIMIQAWWRARIQLKVRR